MYKALLYDEHWSNHAGNFFSFVTTAPGLAQGKGARSALLLQKAAQDLGGSGDLASCVVGAHEDITGTLLTTTPHVSLGADALTEAIPSCNPMYH